MGYWHELFRHSSFLIFSICIPKHLVCCPKHGWFQTIFVKLTENLVKSQSQINVPLLVFLGKIYHSFFPQKGCRVLASLVCWQCSSSYQYWKCIWTKFFCFLQYFHLSNSFYPSRGYLMKPHENPLFKALGALPDTMCYNHVMQCPTTIVLHTCKYTLYVVDETLERLLKVISYSWISLVFQELCCLDFLSNFNWQ